MKISISNGIEQFEAVEVSSVEELANLALQSNISTSVFKGGKRNIENFEKAEVIGLDIDNDNKKGTPSISLNEVKRVFSGFKHIILGTKSHNVEKNGIVAERFRIILFLETPIVAANDFYSTWYYLKAQFPWIDNQCKDPSRFWFQHKEILSVSEIGSLITPIRYTEPEKPTKDGRPVLPGERGDLAKETLKFLEFGVEAGSRNGTVYKVARDFQQALYEYEEAEQRILSALERNQVLANDFTDREAKLAIRSAFSKDAKHAPRLKDVKPRAFHYQRLGDLLNSQDIQEDWLVDGLLIKGGVSVMVGIPKVGKTTIVRQLEKCVLRGEQFLERKVQKGTVVHYSFDEKAKTAKRHYQKLGLNDSDNMVLHFGIAGNENYFRELEEDLLKIKPTFAVIDTLFDMVDVEDVNSYGPLKRKLAQFSHLAEKTDCHIMFIHHQNKPNQMYKKGSGHSVLGSTAIFGSVDCCLIVEEGPYKNQRVISALGRAIDSFDQLTIVFDAVKMIYKLSNDIEDMF